MSTSSLEPRHSFPAAPENHAANHGVFLALSVLILVASFVLQFGEDAGPLQLPGAKWQLPPLCASRLWLGLNCPGCGLTRSFVALAHGDWQAAWLFNPAGPFWFVLVALQVPYRVYQLWRLRQGRDEWPLGPWGDRILGIAVALLIIQWTWRKFSGE
jgi:Protein of unknown function (DUF2752)